MDQNQNTNTAVAVQQKNFATLKTFLASDEVKNAIKTASPKHMTADRQLRIALTAAMGNPKIAEACMTRNGQVSIMKALLTATQRGLELDGRQGHLVPFNDKRLGMTVQFIPGYQGLIDLAYNHPKVKSIWWNVVREKDEFKWADGLNRELKHIKYDGDDDPGKPRFAYAVCELDGGAKSFVVLNRREVMKAKGYSRGATSEYSPWVTNEDAMWGKTAVRALAKQIPQCPELRDALADDDEASTLNEDKFTATQIPSPGLAAMITDGKDEPERNDGDSQGRNEDDGDLGPQNRQATTQPAKEKVVEKTPEKPPQETKKDPEPKKEAAAVTTPSKAQNTADTAIDGLENSEIVTILENKCRALEVPEEKFCAWFCKKFGTTPSELFFDLPEMAPKKIKDVLKKWPTYLPEITKLAAA